MKGLYTVKAGHDTFKNLQFVEAMQLIQRRFESGSDRASLERQ